jgi:hypothetical protein
MPPSKLEVVCVTGLPARAARPLVPPFFCAKNAAHTPVAFINATRLSILTLFGLK